LGEVERVWANVGPKTRNCPGADLSLVFLHILFFLGFWFLVCYAATQLALQLQQKRMQMVRSMTELNDTPAMDLGQYCFEVVYVYVNSGLWNRNYCYHYYYYHSFVLTLFIFKSPICVGLDPYLIIVFVFGFRTPNLITGLSGR